MHRAMVEATSFKSSLSGSARFSYFFIAGALVVIGLLHLASALVVALFTFLALACFSPPIRGGKWVGLFTVVILLAGISYGLGYFIHTTVQALPEIGDKAIPAILSWAKEYGIQLPFTDYDSLKDFAIDSIKGEAKYFGDFAKLARSASSHFLLLAAGCLIAIGVFLNPRFELTADKAEEGNAYSAACQEIAARFSLLYASFSTVMGAQVIISAINTTMTAIFVLAAGLPYAVVMIGMTFLCGLIPVIGNLISNSVVVAIGFTVSPRMALFALIFLVVVHKLEYLLNSKIVGWRIRNPFWLTLLALLLGERLLGIPGMILGPVLLNYLRREASRFKSEPPGEKVVQQSSASKRVEA